MKRSLILSVILTGTVIACPHAYSQTTTTSGVDAPGESAEDTDSAIQGDPFEPSRVLAIVGGEPIFVGDILFEINQLMSKFMPNAPASVRNREMPAILEKLLPKYIEQRMLLIDVKRGLPKEVDFEEVIKTASKEFDDKALETMMESAGVSSPVEFDAQLRAQGASLRKLRETWTINQIVRYFTQQKLKIDGDVSHQELLQFYRDNEQDYQTKARARWEQVMVRREKFKSEQDAKKAIIEMGNSIVYGASLAGVARKSSHGFRASDGGQHDWTTQGSLVLKELDNAIFSLPVGQLSDIIETEQGFHIIRVLEREEAGKVDFREAQVEIRKHLEETRRLAAYDAHMEKLRREIPVEIVGVGDRTASGRSAPQGTVIR